MTIFFMSWSTARLSKHNRLQRLAAHATITVQCRLAANHSLRARSLSCVPTWLRQRPLTRGSETWRPNYETRPPTDILLKTEEVTLVLEGIGDRKIRFAASSSEDAKVILEGQALGVRAEGNQLWNLRKARAEDPVEERPLD